MDIGSGQRRDGFGHTEPPNSPVLGVRVKVHIKIEAQAPEQQCGDRQKPIEDAACLPVKSPEAVVHLLELRLPVDN